jgi:hypothetical protein
MSEMEDKKKLYLTKQENFMKNFRGNPILSDVIPEITGRLLYDEFGINFVNPAQIAIVFTEAWAAIGRFVHDQQVGDFSVDICGVAIGFKTDFTQSDKPTNIVPVMTHKRAPLFKRQDHQIVAGSSFNDELLQNYNAWRTVNMCEVIDKLEREIFAHVMKEYGIALMVPQSVFPIIAAVYAAGLQVARETGESIELYNMFEITVLEGDKVAIEVSAPLKQYIKDDPKQYM